MPDSPVVPSSVAGGQPAGVSTPAPAGSPAPDTMTRAEQIQAYSAIYNGLSQQIAKAITPPPPPAPDPKDRGTQLFQRFAAGDLSDVDARVDARLQENGVVGFLGARAQAEAAANERTIKDQVDAEFGPGTYEAELKPIVDRQLGDSVAARSLPQAWDNAVASAKGQKFGVLAEKRSSVQKTAADAAAAAESARMNAPWMPGNGFAPMPTGQLSDSDKALMAKVSAKVGGRVPKASEAAALRDLMMTKGADGVSMEDIDALGISIPTA